MTSPTLPPAQTGGLRHLTGVAAGIADLVGHYNTVIIEARDAARIAKRARPAAPRHVTHWEEVAARAERLLAATLVLARTHHDLVSVAQIAALTDVVERSPGSDSADAANAALDADETEAALLLAHADRMREPDPEEEPEPAPSLAETPRQRGRVWGNKSW